MSETALPRRTAHAESDSLEHSAPPGVSKSLLVRVLARNFLAGEAAKDEIVSRCTQALGRRWSWLRPLADRYLKTMSATVRPRQREVVQFLQRDRQLALVWAKHGSELSVERWIAPPSPMQPAEAAKEWEIPPIRTAGELADLLWLEPQQLDWFADLKALGQKDVRGQLRHYFYQVQLKPSGRIRLIEAPKRRLKRIQREILASILEKIPIHPAVHGFVKGRSIQTFAAPHVGQRVLLRMDLENFFPTITRARTQALFRTMGYPESVADLLGGICTNVAPRDVWNKLPAGIDLEKLQETRMLYAQPHLPQGAPTSPALANACFYRTDCRLTGLAKAAGATYTRYADDLAFSGGRPFERGIKGFVVHVAAILLEQGFRVQHRKTRVMREGVRKALAGLVTNQRINVARPDFDQLKAILTNCARYGPQTQNRGEHPDFRAHLEGRIGFIASINPEKAKRLWDMFAAINWRL